MSISAYKVEKLELADAPVFDLQGDDRLMAELGDEILTQLNDQCTGFFELPVARMKLLLKADVEEDVRSKIRDDILEAEKSGRDTVSYYAC